MGLTFYLHSIPYESATYDVYAFMSQFSYKYLVLKMIACHFLQQIIKCQLFYVIIMTYGTQNKVWGIGAQ